MLTLFAAPGTVALATHVALREAGAPFELKLLDFPNKEQHGQAYLLVNPKGRVPALETERGVLTEAPAILTWIAGAHPEAGLAPADPWASARMQEAMSFFASTVHVNHAHGPRGERWADRPEALADMKAKVPRTMTAAYAHAEAHCLAGPWVLGEGYSVADPYLFAVGRWLEGDGLRLADFPKLAAHRARMLERPAVKAALSAEGLPTPPTL
ncbi:MAG: glutathione S-transferase family protein [Pseudomonadota bacterium]